jgi:hypothetical protein
VNDRGSMMPLFGGAIVMVLVMVWGVATATSLLIERHRLYSLADGAAVFASENFDPALVSRAGGQVRAPLSSPRVDQAAHEFLRRVGPGPLAGVVLESARTPDGWHAVVRVSSLWSPPLVSEFFPPTLRIRVDAKAQTFLR